MFSRKLGFLLPKEVGLYRRMEIKIELIMDLRNSSAQTLKVF